jgi:putative PIG3 family NAD(P)H quinone oxidoreductase
MDRMTAIEIVKPGGPEVLVAAERPMPQPAHGEVLIKVAAAGVNRPDVMQRKGQYPPPPGASDIPGLEIAGHVAAIGPGVDRYKVGDAVCGLVAGGGYATHCVAPAVQCLPVPKGLSMVEAAAIPETFFTVWPNLFERGRLQGGERVLVHGGSSGIGTTAIMLASAAGARVFATAGSKAKCAACEALGAERGIDYKTEDFVAVVKDLTKGQGVDVVLDIIGAEYFAKNVDVLGPEGRLVQIATQSGLKAEINLLAVMQKRLHISGSTLRPRPIQDKARIALKLEAEVWPLFESGRIKPVVDSIFPLAEASKAHARMDSSQHIGKIVLTV